MPEEWKLDPGGKNSSDDFLTRADAQRRAGRSAEAEDLLLAGLEENPTCAKSVLLLALVLLDQDRSDEAHVLLETWANADAPSAAGVDSDSEEVFDGGVTEGEFEHAFEVAETDPDEVLDADAIAQRAMRETDFEFESEFTTAESSFATRTVADLLAQQGDERGASRVRALVDPPGGECSEVPITDRSTLQSNRIRKLEKWLENIRGEDQ